MMNRVKNVLENKRKARDTKDDYKAVSFKVKLAKTLEEGDELLNCNIVEVTIHIDDNELAYFGEIMYSSMMSEYTIKQTSTNDFAIGRKEVDF